MPRGFGFGRRYIGLASEWIMSYFAASTPTGGGSILSKSSDGGDEKYYMAQLHPREKYYSTTGDGSAPALSGVVATTAAAPRRISLSSLIPEEPICEDAKEGLFNRRAIFFLLLWYFFSFCTLFLNKYILTTLGGDATLLAAIQMVMTLICGLIQMYLPCGMYQPIKRDGKPPNFLRNMILVGCTRFTTVILGLIALKFVAVSFTETIKSSAPIFTVLIARVVLGERTGLFTNLSLLPVMGGLALCSSYELSFNLPGFVAALATNITECLQNVFSKMLVSGKKYRYTPAELQFYTSCASVVVEIPALFVLVDFDKAQRTGAPLAAAFVLNGVFFHFQSISAYVLMGYISPVTHSVANTTKRALLIWLSVVIFGNPVTLLSGLGTGVVLAGVLLYNKAREVDTREAAQARRLHYATPRRGSQARHLLPDEEKRLLEGSKPALSPPHTPDR